MDLHRIPGSDCGKLHLFESKYNGIPMSRLKLIEDHVEDFKQVLKKAFNFDDYANHPPFSSRQLIAAAILTSPEKTVQIHDFHWLLQYAFQSFISTRKSCKKCFLSSYAEGFVRELDRLYSPFRAKTGKFLSLYAGNETRLLPPGPDETPFPFLRLPFELQLLVYRQLLRFPNLTPTTIPYSDTRSRFKEFQLEVDGYAKSAFPREILALLTVNKEVSATAKQVFYRDNTFEFDSLNRVRYFLVGIGPERRQYLRRLVIKRVSSYDSIADTCLPVFRLLSDLTQLEYLKVTIDNSISDSMEILQALRNIRNLRHLEIHPRDCQIAMALQN